MPEPGRLKTHAISALCSLGLFLAGYIFYSSSLIESYYAVEFHLTSWQIGIAQSTVPLGAIAGAVIAGRLADFLGRQRLLLFNFLALTIAGLLSVLVFNFSSLCMIRLLNGLLAGTLYPLCAAYLTEMTPHASLARQSAMLMFINCLAAPFAGILALLLALLFADVILWRLISIGHALPAFIAYLWVRKLPESRDWLLCDNKPAENKIGIKPLLNGLQMLFGQTYRRVTLCLMAAWFLMDIAYYGINFFVPYLLKAMQVHAFSAEFSAQNEALIGALVINIFFMLGALAAVFVIEKVNLINLQKYGFLFAALSLLLLTAYFYFGVQQQYLIIVLFVLFNVALNVGPDVTTFLLSATSYPIGMRASGHGLVAGFAKLGSFLGVLFLPRLQDKWGYEAVMLLLAVLLFAACLFTLYFARTTTQEENGVVYETH